MSLRRDIHPARRRGNAAAWLLAAIAGAATAAMVVVFLRNLPAPPRYDELTIEPGSTTPVMRGIVRRVYGVGGGAEGVDGTEPVTTATSDVAIESWPNAADGTRATLVVHRIPVERADTTFAVIGVEGTDVDIVIRRGRSVVLRTSDRSTPQPGERFEIESDSIILPKGASDLEVEIRPTGDAPAARLWWREVDDESDVAIRRPIGELLEEVGADG